LPQRLLGVLRTRDARHLFEPCPRIASPPGNVRRMSVELSKSQTRTNVRAIHLTPPAPICSGWSLDRPRADNCESPERARGRECYVRDGQTLAAWTRYWQDRIPGLSGSATPHTTDRGRENRGTRSPQHVVVGGVNRIALTNVHQRIYRTGRPISRPRIGHPRKISK